MGAVTAGGRIEVDPEVLLRAGKRVSFIGANLDALSTSLGAALGSGVASGWDPAGAHFGLTYGDLAQQFANTLAKAATAFKFSGVRLEATGYNYKNADASSTIGGGGPAGSVGAMPTETKAADTPTGPSGSIVPPPGNWWLIQGMLNAIPVIGSAAGAVMTWPTGDPSLMRLTAAQWKNFATGFSAFNDDLPALKTALSQQHIPEQGKIQECLGDLATYLPDLSNQATNIATSTENFANGVQKAQDAIRRLLDRISPEGLWDAVTGVFSGDGLDLLRQVADDVGSVLENFQNEIKGIVGLLGDVSKALGEALNAFQKWVKPALIAAFGEEVGGALAEAVTFYTDIQLGLVNSLIGAVSGIVSLADIDTYKGMAEMALSVAKDPSTLDDVLLNMGKQFIAYDQLTGDHPGRGVGEAAGNIAQLFMPGGAASKTGSIAKGFQYGSKLLEEGRLPRLSDIPGFGKSPTGLDNLPGAGPGHPPEFTPPRLPDSLANPSAPPHFDPPHETPQGVGGSGGPPAGPPGGGPPDPPGGRPVGPPESGPSHTDGPTSQSPSPSSGAGEPPRVSEPTAPSAPSHAPSSSDAPTPAAPHAPESPSPASPHETGGQPPSEPGPSPSEHSAAPPEPSGNGVAEPRGDGNYAPNESHQPTSQGHNGPATEGAHTPADQQPAHAPASESPTAHEPTRTDGSQPHEPTHAPSDANTQPHEPAATPPAPMAGGGMPMAPHTPGPVHSPSDSPASRGPSPDSTPRTPESKAPQAGSPESPRAQTPGSAGPGPSSTPSAPVSPASEHPTARGGEAPEARPRPPAPEARGPVGPSHQDPPKPPDPPRPPPTEPRPPDAAPPSDHDPNRPGDGSSPSPGGDHDAPLFDESGAGYPDSYPLPPNSALMPPHDGAFFWSGRDAHGMGIGPESAGGDGSAARIADSFNGTTLEGLLERNGIEPPKWSPDDPAAERWWSDVSDMYAGNVSGEVRAVVGSQLRPGNIWESVELPRLMENPAVTRITQIDAETGHATEIFSRHPDLDSGASHERPSSSPQGAESRSPAGTHDPERGPPERFESGETPVEHRPTDHPNASSDHPDPPAHGNHPIDSSAGDHTPDQLPEPAADTPLPVPEEPVFNLTDPLSHMSPELRTLSEQHLTGSGETVLGPFNPPGGGPSYIDVAEDRGASYFSLGDEWDNFSPIEQLAANQHVLDIAATNRDIIRFSIDFDMIRPGSYTAAELKYLEKVYGYVRLGDNTLIPPPKESP